MGYYVSGGGPIGLSQPVERSKIEEVERLLRRTFDEVDVDYCIDENEITKDSAWITIDSKWRGDEEIFSLVSELLPVTEGSSVEFLGEDGERWRYVFRGGVWVEQIGRTVWEDR